MHPSPKKLIPISWIAHLKDEAEKERFKNQINSSSDVLDRLKDILDQKIADRSVFKEVDYKDASWAYSQADRNGYVRALMEVISLIGPVSQ